ncbi:MAG: phosphotransferase, partial [Acidimicrobiia bacterium]
MTDTAPIRPEEGFDEDAVAAFLSIEVADLEPPFVFEQFPGGKANLTYLARDAAGRELVLRRPPLGEVAPASHDMSREHRVLSRLWERYP